MMKNVMFTICLFVCVGLLVATSGCGGSADALARIKTEIEILPNSEVHAGKDSAKIAEEVIQANLLKDAMGKGVITDSLGLVSAAKELGL